MKNFFNSLRLFIADLKKVSKLTKTKNKKTTIFLLAICINLLVFLDIGIIVFFASLFSNGNSNYGSFVELVLSYRILLPIFVILRFSFVYLEKVITTKLQFKIEKNLRIYLTNEAFVRGNISISDAYFFVNTLSMQVGKFYSTLSSLIASIIQIISFTVYLLMTNYQSVLIFSIGSMFLFLPTFLLTKIGRSYAHKAYIFGQKISDNIEKIFENLFLIKILDTTKTEINEFSQNLKNYYQARFNEIKTGTVNEIMPNFLTLFILSIVIIFFDVIKFLTLDFIGILIRLFQSLGIFNKNVHMVSSFHVYLEKLYEIERNKELVFSDNFQKNSSKLQNTNILEFENVSFRYVGSDEYIFKNLNFHLFKDKHTILTGPNGSGKSTLIGLVSGVFYSSEGKVRSTYRNVAYVSSTPLIFNGTLKENIMYGNENTEVNVTVIENLLKEISLYGTESNIDLDKLISNKSLSMGQMQKVAIVRAIISNPDFLILDEATSNLDKQSKILFYNLLNNLNITILNSTHSLDEVTNYDYHIEIVDVEKIRKVVYVE